MQFLDKFWAGLHQILAFCFRGWASLCTILGFFLHCFNPPEKIQMRPSNPNYGTLLNLYLQLNPLNYSMPLLPPSRKMLVLDLDETLIHSSVRETSLLYDFKIEVTIDRMACLFFVHKRPHVDFFLTTVSKWYRLVIFTAAIKQYAEPIVDALDNGYGYFSHRFYRESCIRRDQSFIKDLTLIDSDMANILIIDNSPGAYFLQPENAIPIESWLNNSKDEALLDLIPFLDALRFTRDVRSILSLRLR